MLDLTAKTNITAREFADCYDLLHHINQLENEEQKEELTNQLCAILYPKCKSHTENMVSGHIDEMKKVNPIIKYIVIYWFTGLVRFYLEHPIYSILFSRNKQEK